MNETDRLGIIDIGSNSIRLVIFECNSQGSYRVIDEVKESARLSERVTEDGELPKDVISFVSATLLHFRMLCEAAGTSKIRAIATAAIRNAKHSDQIVEQLQLATSLNIEILSGEQEAYLGFLGMINTIDVQDGFLIDIGGGSTELTLFLNRTIVHSFSFPMGSVQLTKKYGQGGEITEEKQKSIQRMIEQTARKFDWIHQHPGLPLIGVGGTVRSLCNIDQKSKQYSLPMTHNYQMTATDIDQILARIQSVPVGERKSIEGLAKQRSDIIVPGTIILQTLFRCCNSSHYVISGSGIRDGLYHTELSREQLSSADILSSSILNLLHQHPIVPVPHVNQVNRFALQLFDVLQQQQSHGQANRSRQLIDAASMLYRIGISIMFYNFRKHTFYLIAHSQLSGLTHREIVLCATIASYKNKKSARLILNTYSDIVSKEDLSLVCKLGTLLQLAIALDRSETQPIQLLKASVHRKELQLFAEASSSAIIEARQVSQVADEFQKEWKLTPTLAFP
ncbi:MAG: Ppx/GppA phosphatase family protein [Paenibacillaceae bacterium]